MTTPRALHRNGAESGSPPATRIWRLQFGPCWCHSAPSQASAFDYVRLRRTSADLGPLRENLLIVSERVIEGSARMYREVHSSVPDPKLVISAGTCPTAHQFWDDLPGGWAPVDEILPVDIRVAGCVSGNPEALVAALLEYLFAEKMSSPPPGVVREAAEVPSPGPLAVTTMEPSDA